MSSVKCLLFMNYSFPIENSLNFSRAPLQIKISLESPVPCSYYLKQQQHQTAPGNLAMSLMSEPILSPYPFIQISSGDTPS